MDIMETFTVDMTGGLWALPVGAIAICSSIIVIVVNIGFAVAVFQDATYLRDPRNLRAPRKPIFVGRIIWFLATLIGGVFVVGIYWIMHHSRLNQSIPVTPPED